MEDEDFPWELGVFDAHCHPTDTMSSIHEIPSMKTTALTIMSTRQEDQSLVLDTASESSINGGTDLSDLSTCRGVVPSFGWHPWFSHQMFDDTNDTSLWPLSEDAKVEHYQKVLKPKPERREFVLGLPDPLSLSQFLHQTREKLLGNPLALVGEVGLDKAFRLPEAWLPDDINARDGSLTPGGREGRKLSPYRVQVAHQQQILLSQLKLAAENQRAASVHGVQVHGILLETLESMWKRSSPSGSANTASIAGDETLRYPPRICLHSYSGSVDTMKRYFQPTVPVEFYMSFSILVNFSSEGTSKSEDVVKELREDRILIESDMHIAGPEMDKNLEAIARKVCEIKGWKLRDGVHKLAQNWVRFIEG